MALTSGAVRGVRPIRPWHAESFGLYASTCKITDSMSIYHKLVHPNSLFILSSD
jgi:hypothetical protein